MPILHLRRKMDDIGGAVVSQKFRLGDPSSCNLVFLSARPHIYKEMMERRSYYRFKQWVSAGQLHKMPTLLPGRLWPGIKAVLLQPFLKSCAWEGVGQLKFEIFKEYCALYPEHGKPVLNSFLGVYENPSRT